jgi:hypothetical protein
VAVAHLFGGPLSYMGFGGMDQCAMCCTSTTYDLIVRQLKGQRIPGSLFNVGG